MSDNDETRQCTLCGERKPLHDFDSWFTEEQESTQAVCAQCRGWRESPEALQDLRAWYQEHSAIIEKWEESERRRDQRHKEQKEQKPRQAPRKPIPMKVRQEIYEQYHGECAYCGCQLDPPGRPYQYPAELKRVRAIYQAQRQELQTMAIWATGKDSKIVNEARWALEHGELVQRYRELYQAHCAAIARRSHIDHPIPVTRGGTEERSNLVLACQSCNSRKLDLTVEEFEKHRTWRQLLASQGVIHLTPADAAILDRIWDEHGRLKSRIRGAGPG
jgi:5-methylcytosine-specific restriction endonuclease McrA